MTGEPQRLLGEGPTPVVNRDPRPYLDVQTEPLEMMGGSGLVSVPLSISDISSKTSMSLDMCKADDIAPSLSKLLKSDFPNTSHGVL